MTHSHARSGDGQLAGGDGGRGNCKIASLTITTTPGPVSPPELVADPLVVFVSLFVVFLVAIVVYREVT